MESPNYCKFDFSGIQLAINVKQALFCLHPIFTVSNYILQGNHSLCVLPFLLKLLISLSSL